MVALHHHRAVFVTTDTTDPLVRAMELALGDVAAQLRQEYPEIFRRAELLIANRGNKDFKLPPFRLPNSPKLGPRRKGKGSPNMSEVAKRGWETRRRNGRQHDTVPKVPLGNNHRRGTNRGRRDRTVGMGSGR
jgi:hypothetical protein